MRDYNLIYMGAPNRRPRHLVRRARASCHERGTARRNWHRDELRDGGGGSGGRERANRTGDANRLDGRAASDPTNQVVVGLVVRVLSRQVGARA